MPTRDPDGTWNWGPLEGVGRGLVAAARDFGNQIVGNTGPAGSNPNLFNRLLNMGAAYSTPESFASTGNAFVGARNGAIAGNGRPGSVVARGRIGDRSGLGPTRNLGGPPAREGLLGPNVGPSGGGRDPNFRMQGSSDWAQNASGAGRAATDAANAEITATARGETSDINDFRNGGGSRRGQSRLGAGQLGRGGDEALNAASRSMYNRRGTQAEM